MSGAVRRTLKSSGESSSSSRSRSTGCVEPHRERRAALREALDRDVRGAELADRVLEPDQLRVVPERADLDLDRALEEAVEGSRGRTGRWSAGAVAVVRSRPGTGPRRLPGPRRRSAPARADRPRPPRAVPSSGSGSPGRGPGPESPRAGRRPTPARRCCGRGARWPRRGARAGRGSRARARSPSPRASQARPRARRSARLAGLRFERRVCADRRRAPLRRQTIAASTSGRR